MSETSKLARSIYRVSDANGGKFPPSMPVSPFQALAIAEEFAGVAEYGYGGVTPREVFEVIERGNFYIMAVRLVIE